MLGEGPIATGMGASEVLAMLEALSRAGCRAWVGGGWGVDALAGRTRHVPIGTSTWPSTTTTRRQPSTPSDISAFVETDWRPVSRRARGRC